MSTTQKAVANALRFDALAHAEQLTGQSYKEDKGTEALGFLMHLDHVKNKRAILEFTGDTHFSMPWTDFKAMLPRLGFTIMFTEPFKDEQRGDEEAVCAWDDRRGALIWAETYRLSAKDSRYPPGINSGSVYFCWKSNESNVWLERCSSSPIQNEAGEYIGRSYSYDVREGLKHTLEQADTLGTYMKPWPGKPFLWLLTYMDPKTPGYNHDAITAARLAKLPESVRNIISP